MRMSPQVLLMTLGALLALGCMVTDALWRRIPNALTLPAAGAGLVIALVSGGWESLLWSGAGMLVGFGLLLLPYALGAMGAGDVKLLAALGALLGYPGIVQVFLYAAIAGGVLSLIVIFRRRMIAEAWANIRDIIVRVALRLLRVPTAKAEDLKSVGAIPYGVAIGLGTIAYLYLGAIV